MRSPARLLFAVLLLPAVPATAWQFSTPLESAPPAAALELEAMRGGTLALQQLRGKVVVVNFWATWCPPCVAEMPSLERLRKQLGSDRFEVLAVNAGDEPFDIALFLGEVPVDLPILLDPELRAQVAWEVRVLPTTFIIDPLGRVRFREIGERAWDDPEAVAALRALAEAGAPPPRER
jgi:thiol-disulfide isomerase/thioredoxin